MHEQPNIVIHLHDERPDNSAAILHELHQVKREIIMALDQKVTDAQQRVIDKIANENAEVAAAVTAGMQPGFQALKDQIQALKDGQANGSMSPDEVAAAFDALIPMVDDISVGAGKAATEGSTDTPGSA